MSNDENKEHYLKAELYRLVQQDSSIFEFIQNGSLDGIWYWDIENPEQEWLSPRFKEIFGYEDHEIPNTSTWWQENIFPEDLVVAIDNFNRHCADPNHPYDQIVRYRHKDGSTVWVRCRGLAIRDANGKALRLLGAHTNITALKEAEGLRLESLERLVKERTRELQKSETQFKTLLESVPDGVVVCDESGKIVLVNDETERLFGYKRDELIGLSVEMLVPDVHRKRHAQERTASESEPIRRLMSQRTDLFAKRKNGTVFPAEISLSPTTIADQTLVMALVRDVTDIRAVFDSILRLATLVDTSPDAIFSSGLDGTIKSWNKGAERLYGYSEKEAIGMPLARLAPPDRLHEQAPMLEAISQGHSAKHLDTVRVRKDGARVPVSIISFPIKDSFGNPIEMAGVVRDLTDQKKLEAQFQHAQRMEAIGSLAGGVAHDFNNVLTTIKGYGSLLQDKLPSPSQEQEMISAMLRASERATRLTAQLLAFSRKQHLETKILDINTLLSELDLVLPRTTGEIVRLTTEKRSSWYVKADPAQLEQVVLNLVVNARDAMPSGGSLQIVTSDSTPESEPPGDTVKFFPQMSLSGPYVRLDVIDNGTGMSRKTVERIFEPFYTTKERGKGTGLGLAAVYGIVIQSGGFIGVDSQVGQGTRFSVFLPKTDGPLDPRSTTLDVFRTEGTETILLVEDDEDVLTLTTTILKGAGYTVLNASTPQKALAAHANTPVDLVLTDVVMPGMSGTDLAKEWTERHPGTPILFISGYTDESVQSIPTEVLLMKPFSPPELLRRVAELLKS